MKGKRKQHTAAFEVQVALAALRGDRTVNEVAGVAVSMDGRCRCLDNVFVERRWRTVKYEDI